MTRKDFDRLMARLTAEIAGRVFDDSLLAHLNERVPVGGPLFEQIELACRTGISAGWLCDREGKEGIRFSRPFKPGPETAGLSVDVVRMGSMTTPNHCHPNGEIDMLMPLDPGATFDRHGHGWAVYGPGSIHAPPVAGGEMIILYLLPDGAIDFLDEN